MLTHDALSRFLPHTVHFELRKSTIHPAPPLPPPVATEAILFAEGLVGPIPMHTPEIATEHEQFFLSNKTSSIGSYFSKVQQISGLPTPTPSETHSPLWGRGVFNQPKSRAEDLPPASILKHSRYPERAARSRAGSITEIREESHDRAFKTADWSIQASEQGNPAVRNAVNAACRSGFVKDRLWASRIYVEIGDSTNIRQVGTLGMPTDALECTQKLEIEEKLENEYDSLTVFATDSDLDGHYSHYCKTILWPVFHYQIPDNPKSKAYEDHSWVYYVKINQAFADRIIKSWKRGDVIWIHDYHLLLVPAMVRKKIPDAQIGFFLHVAFPSSEVFRCLAVRNELLEGVLGANLIGFQTQEYCNHFLQTCNRILLVEATPEGVQLEDRFVNIATFPTGVDLKSLNIRRQEPEVIEWIKRIRAKYQDKQLVVARDKLDHIRGVRQKLLAYELFLNKNPHLEEKVSTSHQNLKY